MFLLIRYFLLTDLIDAVSGCRVGGFENGVGVFNGWFLQIFFRINTWILTSIFISCLIGLWLFARLWHWERSLIRTRCSSGYKVFIREKMSPPPPLNESSVFFMFFPFVIWLTGFVLKPAAESVEIGDRLTGCRDGRLGIRWPVSRRFSLAIEWPVRLTGCRLNPITG